MKKMCILILPISIFLVLFGSFFVSNSINFENLPTYIFGFFAYSIIITNVITSTRPKFLDKMIGIRNIYESHKVFGISTGFFIIGHVISKQIIFKNVQGNPITSLLGFLSILLILVTIITGITLNKKTNKKNNKSINREKISNVHRISILLVILVYVHVISIDFLREKVLFFFVTTAITFITLFLYVKKLYFRSNGNKYEVNSVVELNENLYNLKLKSLSNTNVKYKAGQFAFLRFVKSDLPVESHPFSITSVYSDDPRKIEFIIKNSGDFTSKIKTAKNRDIVTIEGAYGNFFSEVINENNYPIVLIAGGIGITPMLSFIRNKVRNKSTRKVKLIWSVSKESDIIFEEELKKIQNSNSNFEYNITCSSEKTDKYHFGRIDNKFLESLELRNLYSNAYFFVCGPRAMMDYIQQILLTRNVGKERIITEEFSY